MKKKSMLSFIKFCVVGLVNTAISLGIYYLLLSFNISYLLSISAGYIISSVCGYFLNKVWVFKKKEDKITRSIFKYYILYGSALLLNLLCMFIFVQVFNISDKIAPLLTLIITTIYNFLLSKFWVFNSKKSSIDFKKIKKDRSFIIIFSFFVFFVGAMLVNNYFNHPVADDYTNYDKIIVQIGDNEHSFNNVVSAIGSLSIKTYQTWQGTYFANMLFFINPLLVSLDAYKITMLIIQIFWLLGMLFFFQSLPTEDQNSKIRNLKLYFLFTIFSILSMYSLGEGLYWFTGSILYIIPFTMSLIFFGLLIRHMHNPKPKYIPLLILLAIALAGTSYVTGLIVGFVLLFLTVRSFIQKSQYRIPLLSLLMIFCIGFSFNVFCPGNFLRIDSYEKISIAKVLLYSVLNALNMIKHLIFETLFIPLLLIAFPILIQIANSLTLKCKNVSLLNLLCTGCFIATFIPMAYSYGSDYQETRVENIQLLYLVIMCTFCIINYISVKFNKPNISNQQRNQLTLLGIITSIIMVPAVGFENIAGFGLIDDYLYMRNFDYDKCMDATNELLSNPNKEIVAIDACEVYPSSLHYYKITEDTWQTDAIEKYFDKKIIVNKKIEEAQ